MNNFTEKEFEILIDSIPVIDKTLKKPIAFSILIGDKIFVTSNGKRVWKQRNHASCAFTNEMSGKIENFVRIKLQDKGINKYDVYKYTEYKNAFKDFKDALIEKGLFKIIELYDE